MGMQVAIITGAGSGIGLATARHMANMGMAIVGTGRDPERLKALDEVVPADRLLARRSACRARQSRT
jgi:NADP-dependent 3-hydroxy acid dehydrogenase YdfG